MQPRSGRIIFLRLLLFIAIDLILVAIFGMLSLPFLLFGLPTVKKCGTQAKESFGTDKLVILIHGTGVSDWQWVIAKLYLYMSNIPFASVKYNYDQPIHKSCEDVINQIVTFKQNANIILIGHSQGGLIARIIHDHEQIQSHMTFLLNTPQKGATIINWLFPDEFDNPCSFNDMRHGSEFIRQFSTMKEYDNIYEIVGLNDYIRAVNCVSCNKNVYVSWFGHYFSAVNPYLWLNYIIPTIKNAL